MFSPTVEEDHNVRRLDVAGDNTLLVSMLNGMAHLVLVKGEWDHRDITSNIIAYKHLHR